MQGQLKPLRLALLLGTAVMCLSPGFALAAPAAKGKAAKPAPVVEPPPPPQPPAPAGLLDRCRLARTASEAVEKTALGKAGDLFGKIGKGLASTATDRFSISGKEGPFACSTAISQRLALDRIKARTEAEAAAKAAAAPGASTAPPARLALAAQADVMGSLRPTLFNMPETQKRLQAMVDRIAANWPYQPAAPAKVLISANLGYNAEAKADNTIVVWIGVLADDDGNPSQDMSDNDLYWLLGHEYAHLALDHLRNDQTSEKQRQFLLDAARVYQRGAMLESSIIYAETNTTAQDAALAEDYREAKEAHHRLRFMMDRLLYPVWGRMQEDEADAAGFDAVVLLGYYPRYDYSVQKFAASEETWNGRIASVQDGMVSRARKVTDDPRFQTALKEGEMADAFGPVLTALQKGLYEGARKWITDLVSRNHRAAKSRGDGLMRYSETAYEKAGIVLPSELVTRETDAIRKLPELKSALVAATAVSKAEAALNATPPDRAKASQEIGVALAGPFKGEAYVRYYAARVELAYGRPANAIAHLEAARKARYPSPEAYRELVRLYANSGKIAQAQAVIAEGRKRTGDSDFFLPSDIRVLIRQKRFEAVAALFEKCRATARDQVMLDCRAAALDGDFKDLSPADKKRFDDLAIWGEQPKAQTDDPFGLKALTQPKPKTS
jgi:predicted Zn-dependent protease